MQRYLTQIMLAQLADLLNMKNMMYAIFFGIGYLTLVTRLFIVPTSSFSYRQHSILQASWQWRVRKIEASSPADQQILYLQEEIEHMKDSAFYKTEQVLARLAENFKCDCEK